jgi:hypothetical protein
MKSIMGFSILPSHPPHRRARLAITILAATIASAAFLLPASAQQYSINWYKVADGGATSAGGAFSLSGTIGQHDAGGPLSGGNYSLTGGFWAPATLQTPGAPQLYIFLTATNTAVISWTAPAPGWTLRQTPALTGPNGVESTAPGGSPCDDWQSVLPPRSSLNPVTGAKVRSALFAPDKTVLDKRPHSYPAR